MKSTLSLILQSLLASGSIAATIPRPPLRRSPTSNALLLHSVPARKVASASTTSPGNITLTDLLDALYFVNVTIGGSTFPVQFDTGSADLWVVANGSTISTVNTTNITVQDTYASNESISGPVQFAQVQLGGYTIPSQSFINVDNFTNTGSLEFGVSGILGMSFDDPSGSAINTGLQDAYGNTTLGTIPVLSILNQNANLSNSFDVQLNRLSDLEQNGTGIVLIGEHIPGFENITQQPELPKLAPGRWSVPVQNITINNVTFTLGNSTVSTLPPGDLAAVLDTGFALPPIPPAAVDAIYGNIPGAVNVSDIEGFGGQWLVPCTETANVTFTLGSIQYPIHPLDLTVLSAIQLPLGPNNETVNVTFCTNAFTYLQQSFDGVDMILGDPFLRNVVASYNYGTNRTDQGNHSFVQLISTTDPETAYADFIFSRTQAIAQMGVDIAPTTLINLLLDSNTTNPSSNSTNVTSTLFTRD